jgi:hypothetical protein
MVIVNMRVSLNAPNVRNRAKLRNRSNAKCLFSRGYSIWSYRNWRYCENSTFVEYEGGEREMGRL